MHAKGWGAHGTFTVTGDITRYTRAKIFSEVGKKTPMFARFSTVAGERGAADAERDIRGTALKFYTEDGNWDIVGNNTPVFFFRDCQSAVSDTGRTPARIRFDIVGLFPLLRPPIREQYLSIAVARCVVFAPLRYPDRIGLEAISIYLAKQNTGDLDALRGKFSIPCGLLPACRLPSIVVSAQMGRSLQISVSQPQRPTSKPW
jgi:hypothetical protein